LPALAWPFKWTGLRQIGAVLAIVALTAAFLGAFQLLRGSGGGYGTGSGKTVQVASGPAATATATDTPTATPTPAPTATATPVPPHPNVVVTQNQDMRPACVDPTNSYTVVLANNGDVAASWHVDIPTVQVLVPPSRPAGQPLFSPRSSSPWWAWAQPTDGSVAPGQTASFTMNPDWGMPCGGTTYHASIQLTFPSGASEPDIPLTYAGIGPLPYSQIDLVGSSTDLSQPCPDPTATPPPFVIAFKNSGNATAYPTNLDTFQDHVGGAPWALITNEAMNPPNPPGQNAGWLFAGQTWTLTVQPHAGVLCTGTVYHVYLHFNLAQGTSQTITVNVTFH
jgi:hypothetical protein